MRRLTVVLTIAALLIAPASSSAPVGGAAIPTGDIAFSMRFWPEDEGVGDNWEIFVSAASRGPSRNLTHDPRCSELRPSWSRSGRWLTFACGWGPLAGIHVMGADGGERRRIVQLQRLPFDGGVAWSPNERAIAFGAPGIWIVNSDGTGLRRLTHGRDTTPTWSRNGHMIAFERGVRGATEIHVMRANGTGRRRIARRASDPAWSPDGRTIAFLRNQRIWLMSPNGRNQRRFPRGSGSGLAWSPDSRHLAYQVSCCIDAGIYTVAVNGAERPRFVTGALEPQGLTWSRSPG